MTKHTNITKTDTGSYHIRVARTINGKIEIIVENYLSLDDAIEARDTIIRNFESTGKLEHSKDDITRRRLNAIARFGTTDIVELKVKEGSDRIFFAERFICENCGKQDISRSHYLIGSTQCVKCNMSKDSDHQKNARQARINRAESNKNNSIGIKNISYNSKRDLYHVYVERDGKRFRALAKTLEEAIRIKETALKFYKDHGRVPESHEID